MGAPPGFSMADQAYASAAQRIRGTPQHPQWHGMPIPPQTWQLYDPFAYGPPRPTLLDESGGFPRGTHFQARPMPYQAPSVSAQYQHASNGITTDLEAELAFIQSIGYQGRLPPRKAEPLPK